MLKFVNSSKTEIPEYILVYLKPLSGKYDFCQWRFQDLKYLSVANIGFRSRERGSIMDMNRFPRGGGKEEMMRKPPPFPFLGVFFWHVHVDVNGEGV